MKLDAVTLRGYKSIANLEDFKLRDMNVLIGGNGAGKSNFIGLFKLLAALSAGNLQTYVQTAGGPDTFLRGGRKVTSQIEVEVNFCESAGFANGYRMGLVPTADNRFIFSHESTWVRAERTGPEGTSYALGASHEEAKLQADAAPVSDYVRKAMRSWRQYHFHDTSDTAAVKAPHGSTDNLVLKPDAANLAAYLARLHNEDHAAYRRIVDAIKLVAPFFGDFVIRDPLPETVQLEWLDQTDPDTPFKAHMLSDGSLRFICLTTLLLQPPSRLPDTVIIDEPELGLHPFAINLLADMLKQVAEKKQVIVSTQSVELLSAFAPEDVVVVQREQGATTFKRLESNDLQDWLADYALGELWQRNIIGGRPTA